MDEALPGAKFLGSDVQGFSLQHLSEGIKLIFPSPVPARFSFIQASNGTLTIEPASIDNRRYICALENILAIRARASPMIGLRLWVFAAQRPPIDVEISSAQTIDASAVRAVLESAAGSACLQFASPAYQQVAADTDVISYKRKDVQWERAGVFDSMYQSDKAIGRLAALGIVARSGLSNSTDVGRICAVETLSESAAEARLFLKLYSLESSELCRRCGTHAARFGVLRQWAYSLKHPQKPFMLVPGYRYCRACDHSWL